MNLSSRLCFPLLSLFACACDATTPAGPEGPPSASGASSSATVTAPGASQSAPVASASVATPPPAPTGPVASIEEATRYAQSSNAFGLDLYQQIRSQPGNLVMSPVSLSVALGMAWGGAKGETAAEMKKVLHFEGDSSQVMTDSGKLVNLLASSGASRVSIANRLFGEKSYVFEQAFLDQTQKAYGAALEPANFKGAPEQGRETINRWVEDKTEKRIKDLLPSGAIDPTTRLVLVNAVYFLADWARPFEKNRTRDTAFSLDKSNQKQVPTMHAQGSYAYAEVGGDKAIELPYKGGDLSMLVLVPKEVDGVGRLEQDLAKSDKLAAWTKALEVKQVALALPKFEIAPAAGMPLSPVLTKLGMKTAFSRKADFTGIANPKSPEDQLFINQVFHKAFVKVDEKGTEAAAASAVVMATKGAGPAPAALELKVDRPFVYLIRDRRSGLVLFMGRVADPTQK